MKMQKLQQNFVYRVRKMLNH